MSAVNIEPHPYSEVFELIEDNDFDQLVADIAKHGLRDKIWLYEGKILDGRNRYMACRAAKVKPEFREYEGNDPGAFVWSVNAHRRHLTVGQRAMAAAELAKLSVGRPAAIGGIPPITQTKAASTAKVSRDSIKQARKVVDSGSAELKKEVKKGNVSLNKAASVASLPKSEQLKAAQEKPQPKPLEVAPAPDFDFAGYEPSDDEAYKQSVENVMMADDKLAAMRAELEQAHREIQGLKSSRDHYQSQAGEAVRHVKARDREIDRLKREIAKLKGESVATGNPTGRLHA